MAKNFLLQFGSGTTTNAGLAPTFTVFKVFPGGGNTTAPGITEVPSATGLYYFTYEPAASIAFVVDANTTSLSASARYIVGNLDPIQAIDERITEMGMTLVAIGNTGSAQVALLIGTTASSFGSTSTDPATVMGYLKRLQEFNEGNSNFTKQSGAWDIFARGNAVGASTQLIQKVVTDQGAVIRKT